MKIRKVSCTQFAGIKNKTVAFHDGINLLYGKNESGKSTLVNLISRTLFQHSKLNARSDRDFINLYLPAPKRDCDFSGDFADGCVTLEKQGREYTVFKEWGKQPVCRLTAPEGLFKDEETVDALLRNVLGYGEGVYADLLFSSQKNTQLSLQSVLDAKSDTEAKRELVSAVTKAFSQSDGISTDAIERAVREKIEEIAGKHWDRERNMPQRKAGRWVNGTGEILKAYYALEDAQKLTDELKSLEAECDSTSTEHSVITKKLREAEEEYNRLHSFASAAAVFGERKRRLAILEKQLEKYRADAEKWPSVCEAYRQGSLLRKEQESRLVHDRLKQAQTIRSQLKQYRDILGTTVAASESDLSEARKLLRKTDVLKNQLCAMNVRADIRMLSDNTVDIRTVATDETILPGTETLLTQAVNITVPGIMQMRLAPADVDTEEISRQLDECSSRLEEIFRTYGAESIETLEERARVLSGVQLQMQKAEAELRLILGKESFEELEKKAASFRVPARTAEQIQQDIRALTDGTDLLAFITAAQTADESFTSEYSNPDELNRKIRETDAEIKKVKERLENADDIPREYLAIEDIDEYSKNEREKLRLLRLKCEQAFGRKTQAVQRLEVFKEAYGEDIRDRLDQAAADFENCRSLLACWDRILDVFYECKKRIHENPTEELAVSFSKYLAVLTADSVSTDFCGGDRLDMKIFSSDRLLTFGLLSEGTKQTVSLAFRLAVLDRLFPDGGVIVFDDPFSDMDSERKRKACKLIEACAERHQVIFLTCHKEYEEIFGLKAQTIGSESENESGRS